tara:strand:- start:8538 stop:9839 length:1302 start_codon:yes stop_codon:yes gene_type:complete
VAIRVFYSWQADTPTREGRNFIERALERAIARISGDVELEEAIREGLEVDRDTKGVPGSPPIVDTIFRKIDEAAVFIPDVTFVGKRLDGRPTPNPNVMIEYGWALKRHGHAHMVPVMNIAHGEPKAEAMPFDLRHLRNPITYDLPDGADKEHRKSERAKLAGALESAIRAVLSSEEFMSSLPKPPEPPPFPSKDAQDGPARFRPKGEPVAYAHERFLGTAGSEEVHLTDGAAMWLRLMPQFDPQRTWPITELERLATQSDKTLLPLGTEGFTSFNYMRHEDGFGLYAVESNNASETQSVVFAFETGEVWSIDTYLLERTKGQAIPYVEDRFVTAFGRFSDFIGRLGIEQPYRWIAGMEGLKGRPICFPVPSHQVMPPNGVGRCIPDVIEDEGIHAPGATAIQSLKPFFVKLFDKSGIERPNYLDEIASKRAGR